MTTYLTSRGYLTVNTAAETSVEIPLKSVDLAARKIPLIHQVEFQPVLSTIPLGTVTAQYALASSDSISSLYLDDDEVIASFVANVVNGASEEERGSAQILAPPIVEFKAPVAIAKESVWLFGYGFTSLESRIAVRLTYEVKVVSASVLVALLA